LKKVRKRSPDSESGEEGKKIKIVGSLGGAREIRKGPKMMGYDAKANADKLVCEKGGKVKKMESRTGSRIKQRVARRRFVRRIWVVSVQGKKTKLLPLCNGGREKRGGKF